MKIIFKPALTFAALFAVMSGAFLCLQAGCTTPPSIAPELQPLQGTWEGVELGQNYTRKIAIRFTGDSLHYQAATNDWHEGDITLLPATNPQQLRFTMKVSSTPDHIGQVVHAIFKIEDGTLTLLTLAGTEAYVGAPPINFEDKKSTRFELQKVQPQ